MLISYLVNIPTANRQYDRELSPTSGPKLGVTDSENTTWGMEGGWLKELWVSKSVTNPHWAQHMTCNTSRGMMFTGTTTQLRWSYGAVGQ